jgi:hypothetical protein
MALIQSNQLQYPLTGSFTGSFTGSLFGTSSYAVTASYLLNPPALNLIYTGSVTASVDVTNNIFLVKSGSVNFFTITSGTTTLQIDIFLIKNLAGQTTLTVSQSIVYHATQSTILSNATALAGGIYFTSSSFYVGLEN